MIINNKIVPSQVIFKVLSDEKISYNNNVNLLPQHLILKLYVWILPGPHLVCSWLTDQKHFDTFFLFLALLFFIYMYVWNDDVFCVWPPTPTTQSLTRYSLKFWIVLIK